MSAFGRGLGRCKGCALWDELPEDHIDNVTRGFGAGILGHCRAKPPALGERSPFGRWPITDKDDWCLEWREDWLP